jgi:hypothetical protein
MGNDDDDSTLNETLKSLEKVIFILILDEATSALDAQTERVPGGPVLPIILVCGRGIGWPRLGRVR